MPPHGHKKTYRGSRYWIVLMCLQLWVYLICYLCAYPKFLSTGCVITAISYYRRGRCTPNLCRRPDKPSSCSIDSAGRPVHFQMWHPWQGTWHSQLTSPGEGYHLRLESEEPSIRHSSGCILCRFVVQATSWIILLRLPALL